MTWLCERWICFLVNVSHPNFSVNILSIFEWARDRLMSALKKMLNFLSHMTHALIFRFDFVLIISCSYVPVSATSMWTRCECVKQAMKYVSFTTQEYKKSCVLHAFFHYNCFDRWALILLGGPMQEITPFSLDDLHKTNVHECKRDTQSKQLADEKKYVRYEKFLVIMVVWVGMLCVRRVRTVHVLKTFRLFFPFRKRTWTTHELITCIHRAHTSATWIT